LPASADGNLSDFDSPPSLFGEADALFGKSEAPGDVEPDFDDDPDAFD
jgi:hypothetical protein